MDPDFPSKQEFSNLLSKYLKGQCTAQEEQFVIEWYESTGKDKLENLNEEEYDHVEKRIYFTMSSRLSSIDNSIESTTNNFRFWKTTSIAATIVLLIISVVFVYLFKYSASNFFSKGLGKVIVKNTKSVDQKVNLEDGSFVILKSGSSISFPKTFADKQREVFLEGEAFFQVQRDENRPFLVFAGDIVTKVLGTSFVIKEEANKDVVVEVRTGKVAVFKNHKNTDSDSDALNKEVIITPNKQTVFNVEQNLFKTSLVATPLLVDGSQDLKIMKFNNAPLTEIFNALSKAYQVEIEYDELKLKACTLTTTLDKENLFDRLNIICKAIGGTFKMEGTKIIIQNNGCNNP